MELANRGPDYSLHAESAPVSAAKEERSTQSATRPASASYMAIPRFGSNSTQVVARYTDIWLLGICIVAGGQYFDWNHGMAAGFGNFFIASAITAIGYVCLCFCAAEMTSILPFSGGAYGFARVTVNIYGGYIVGCCEAMEYVLYVANAIYVLGLMTTAFLGLPRSYEPLYWFLTYASAIAIHSLGGRYFWTTSKTLALMSILILLVYFFAAIPLMNFSDNARLADSSDPWFGGRPGFSFLHVLPQASWFFVGIEAVPLAGQETESPKRAMPVGIILSIFTLVLTFLAVIFCASATGPSAELVAGSLSPLSYGLSRALDVPERYVYILFLPAVYATSFGFLFASGRQALAMSESGLFPDFLRWTVPSRGTPYMAMIVSSTIGYGALVAMWYNHSLAKTFFNLCIIGSYFSYLSSFVSFVSFRLYFPGLDKTYTYRSPLGLTGALVGFLVFTLCILAVAFFQRDRGLSAIIFLSYIAASSVYYVLVVRYRQRFSPMERSVMMIAHVLKANRLKRINRHGRQARSSSCCREDGMLYSLYEAFLNRWRESKSDKSMTMGDAAVPRESSAYVDTAPQGDARLSQVGSVSVSDDEPFYDELRVHERELNQHQYRGLWAAVRDALAAPGGQVRAPSQASDASGSSDPMRLSHYSGDFGIELALCGSHHFDNPREEDVVDSRRDAGSSMWNSLRDALSMAIPIPSSRSHSLAATPESNHGLSLKGLSTKDAFSLALSAKPVVTPEMSRNNSDCTMKDADLGSELSLHPRGKVYGQRHHPSPGDSYDNSARISENSVEDVPQSFRTNANFLSPSDTANRHVIVTTRRPAHNPSPGDSYDNSARISENSVEDEECKHPQGYIQCSRGVDILNHTHIGSKAPPSSCINSAHSSVPNSNVGSPRIRDSDMIMINPGVTTTISQVDQLDLYDDSRNTIHRPPIGYAASLLSSLRESVSKAIYPSPRTSAAVSRETSQCSATDQDLNEIKVSCTIMSKDMADPQQYV